MQTEEPFRITNVMLKAGLSGPVKLHELRAHLKGYKPQARRGKCFPCIRMNFYDAESDSHGRRRRHIVSIFRSGSIICLGCKTAAEGIATIKKVAKTVEERLPHLKLAVEPKIINVAGVLKFAFKFDLDKVHKQLLGMKYDARWFSGGFPAICLAFAAGTCQIFGNGRAMFWGGHSEDWAHAAGRRLCDVLDDIKRADPEIVVAE